MDYRPARREDLPQLAVISDLCFGDEENYRSLLLENRWGESLVAVDHRNHPVAMVFLFPFTFSRPAGDLSGAYIYSLGVHPDYRGKAIGIELMNYAWDTVIARGMSMIALVPASPSLFQYYARLDYRPFGAVTTGEPVLSRQGEPMTLRPCTPERYLKIREEQLADIPHIAWDQRAISYQKQFSALGGGGLYTLDDGVGCATVEAYNKTLFVKELLVSRELLPQAVAGLRQAFPGWRMDLRTRPELAGDLGLEVRDLAVARYAEGVPADRGYFSLALD